jgi:hypothetical protein
MKKEVGWTGVGRRRAVVISAVNCEVFFSSKQVFS